MTTLVPRGPYSSEELKRLYPEGLQLQLVQIVGYAIFALSYMDVTGGAQRLRSWKWRYFVAAACGVRGLGARLFTVDEA